MEALYFRVSDERWTTEHEFEDLVQVAERHDGAGRDWIEIRRMLSGCVVEKVVSASNGGGHAVYRVRPETVERLAENCIYVEQKESSTAGTRRRPMFERLKWDAGAGKFDQLEIARLRNQENLSRPRIASRTGLGVGTVFRAYRAFADASQPFQKLSKTMI